MPQLPLPEAAAVVARLRPLPGWGADRVRRWNPGRTLAGTGLQVIKAIREIAKPGPQRGQGPGGRHPKEIKAGVSKDDAEGIKKKMAEAGGAVEIK